MGRGLPANAPGAVGVRTRTGMALPYETIVPATTPSSAGGFDSFGYLPPLPDSVVRRARLVVCGRAVDAADAREWLDELGLLP